MCKYCEGNCLKHNLRKCKSVKDNSLKDNSLKDKSLNRRCLESTTRLPLAMQHPFLCSEAFKSDWAARMQTVR